MYCNDEYSISISNLSKCYLIYEQPHHRFMQMLLRNKKRYYQEFWANKNISLKIKRGSTFGIVGVNGSGKSTLLQMICGTLTPTEGEVKINGKVAALLELGAGFNPEFTGRENVYMASALYGISKEQVDAKFQSIEDFADIGTHIDQPVKNYSSGMYVRLAFAVIAHVDADILVIDEALSVGDAIFQQKCMRYIRKFQEKGTLLFVSHDMSSVLNLCENAVWLEKGEIRQIGTAKDVSEAYLKHSLQEVYGKDTELESIKKETKNTTSSQEKFHSDDLVIDYGSQFVVSESLSDANGWKTGDGEITSISVSDNNGDTQPVFNGCDGVKLTIRAKLNKEMREPILGFIVRDRLGQDIFGENTLSFTKENKSIYEKGSTIEAKFKFVLPFLPNGQYVMMASLAEGSLSDNTQHHFLHDAAIINVSNSTVRWGLVGVQFQEVMITKEA